MSVEYHNQVRELEHIFIYAVCGRTSSTAMQRMLNSSNEICVWGESQEAVNKIVTLVDELEQIRNSPKWYTIRKDQAERLKIDYRENRHRHFYPTAFNDIEAEITTIASAISSMLKPCIEVQRFGFKEIHNHSPRVPFKLLNIYPNSKVIFLFRNPLEQWPSVEAMKCWGYSVSVDVFIRTYCEIAQTYIEAFNLIKNRSRVKFVNSCSLFDENFIDDLLGFLNISDIDRTMIGRKDFSMAAKINEFEREILEKSEAIGMYQRLRDLAR